MHLCKPWPHLHFSPWHRCHRGSNLISYEPHLFIIVSTGDCHPQSWATLIDYMNAPGLPQCKGSQFNLNPVGGDFNLLADFMLKQTRSTYKFHNPLLLCLTERICPPPTFLAIFKSKQIKWEMSKKETSCGATQSSELNRISASRISQI